MTPVLKVDTGNKPTDKGLLKKCHRIFDAHNSINLKNGNYVHAKPKSLAISNTCIQANYQLVKTLNL